MGLVKRAAVAAADIDTDVAERRAAGRDVPGLIATLVAPGADADARRWAALDLAGEPEAVHALCAAVAAEGSRAARDAMLTALVETGGEDVVRALVVHLRSAGAELRNAVVEALAQIEATALVVPELLADPDPDVRILTVMALASLRSPLVPSWLLSVVREDEHANVCGAALGELAEVGDASMLAAVETLPARFPQDPFIAFAARSVAERLAGREAA